MNNADAEYNRLLNLVINDGKRHVNRTGIDTIGVFGAQAKFDLAEGFPLLTTKKVWFKGIVHELLWFLSGNTNIKYLVDNDVHIWDEWAYAKYVKEHKNGLEKNPDQRGTVLEGKPIFIQEFISLIKSNPAFARQWGDLGEGTYGGMWRKFPYCSTRNRQSGDFVSFEHVDQIQNVINKLQRNPDDRRMIVSAWHPYWVDHCALPPCHCMFQFHTEELTEYERLDLWQKKFCTLPDRSVTLPDGRVTCGLPNFEGKDFDKRFDEDKIPKRRLNLQLYQRSCDLGLGVPYNIASYSLLLMMVAQVSNMLPGVFTHTYGDLHIYENHLAALREQLTREPYPSPNVSLNLAIDNIFDFRYDDVKLENYKSHPSIKMDVAV